MYRINRVANYASDDTIIESLQRSGTPIGKSQAYTLAKKMGRQFPSQTVFIEEVKKQSDIEVIAICGDVEIAKERYPEAEILSTTDLKIKTLRSLFDATVTREAANLGLSELKVRQMIIGELSKQAE